MATTRSFNDSVFRPGIPVTVKIHTDPGSALAYALEETPPTGWVVSEVNSGGNFVGGKVKWGVFFDSTPRDLTYKAMPQGIQGVFSGVISLDGGSTPIQGKSTIKIDDVSPLPPS